VFQRGRRSPLDREVAGDEVTGAVRRQDVRHERRRVRDNPVEDDRHAVDGAREHDADNRRVLQTTERGERS
jgi:hypothetical protein